MNNQSLVHRIWRIARIPLAVIFVLYVGLVIYRIPAVREQERTAETIEKIRAQKLTLTDVLGNNLPPEPDPALKDATIEGIDANKNGIRDDVELAIFKLHPDSVPPESSGSSILPERSGSSTRIRAAELQYAMALQTELTQVFNSETWVAVTQKKGRGFGCIYDAFDGDADYSEKITEVENLVRNTTDRKKRYSNLDTYRTSFKVLSGQDCDVDK